jgi:hypothetical protein
MALESNAPEKDNNKTNWNTMAEDLGIAPRTESCEEPFGYANRSGASTDAYDTEHIRDIMKDGNSYSRQLDADAPVPALEDSSLDTASDASEEASNKELARNKLAAAAAAASPSPRHLHPVTPDSPISCLDEELSAPPEPAEWELPTTPVSSTSMATNLVSNTGAPTSSRRNKSGAGMFSKTLARNLDISVNIESNDEVGLVQPRRRTNASTRNEEVDGPPMPHRRPKASSSNDEEGPVQPKPRRRTKDSTSNEEYGGPAMPRRRPKASSMKTKESSKHGHAKAERRAKGASRAKAKKREMPARKKREVADDDSSDSGSLSTVDSSDKNLVTAFLDLLDLDLDPFEEDNPFEEEHSVGTATVSFDSEGSGSTDPGLAPETSRGAEKVKTNSSLCESSFEEMIEYITTGGAKKNESEENDKDTEERDTQPASSSSKKVKRSKKIEKVEKKLAQEESTNIGTVAAVQDSSPALSISDFFDVSFFIDLWNELISPKNNLGMAPTDTAGADQKSPNGDQAVVNLSVGDQEAENLFDDLLEDDANDDNSVAWLASKYSKTLRESTKPTVDSLYGNANVTAETLNESQEELTPNTSLISNVSDVSAEIAPKAAKKNGHEDWQPFFDSPFEADGLRIPTALRRSVSTPMGEPTILKRLGSLDQKYVAPIAKEQEVEAPVIPDGHKEAELIYSLSFDIPEPNARIHVIERAHKQQASSPPAAQLYPPSDEAFEKFETVAIDSDNDEEQCSCRPESRLFEI